MEETDFNIVRESLRGALIEMKKGEHDQLGTGLAPYSEGHPAIKTFEEIIDILIEGVFILEERWNKE